MSLNGELVPRLRLNERDRPYYQPFALEGSFGTPKYGSHKLLTKAYKFFHSRLVGLQEQGTDPEVLWTSLMKAFSERLYVIRIEVDDIESAQQIFEALNSAGLDLTQADLIKNYALREVTDQDRDDAHHAWISVADAVEEDSALTTYIRTYWNSRYGFARKSELYKRIKEIVVMPALTSDHVPPKTFVFGLNDEVDEWLGIRDANLGNIPAALSADLHRDLGDLRAFNAQLVHVPLLAIARTTIEEPAQFVQAVRWMRDFFVRHTIVGRRAANEVEIKFSEWARQVRRGELSLGDFFQLLRGMSPPDEAFEAEFRHLQVRTQRVARVLLARINDYVNPDNVISQTMTDGQSVHLEHIIPQQPALEVWGPTLDDFHDAGLEFDDIKNNIANLTLLRPSDNIGIGNGGFIAKRQAYEAKDSHGNPHPAPINELLTEIEEFGPGEFAKRQAWLAQHAQRVWALTY